VTVLGVDACSYRSSVNPAQHETRIQFQLVGFLRYEADLFVPSSTVGADKSLISEIDIWNIFMKTESTKHIPGNKVTYVTETERQVFVDT